jgi:HSP20 family protein
MPNLTWWRRTSPWVGTLRRDIDEILDEVDPQERFRSRRFAMRPLRWGLTRILDKVGDVTRLSKRGGELFAPDVQLLTERDDAYFVCVGLPGFRDKDVEIRVDGEMLVISGERRHEETKRERGYEYTQRNHGSFTRSIELPRGVDMSRIEAELVRGVLEVRLPKRESARGRQVAVRGADRERADREGAWSHELGRREEPRVRPSMNRSDGALSVHDNN